MMHVAQRFLPGWHGKWLFCLGVCLLSLALTCWPQALLHFRYERAALGGGELWRAASAHLVHLNLMHWLLNAFGMILICELFWRDLPLRHGAGLLACAAIGVSALLWYFHPALAWYAGLSAILHGLWAGCALASVLASVSRHGAQHDPRRVGQTTSDWLGWGGLLLLAIKLLAEAHAGAAPDLAQTIGAPVATVSHLYGAIVGAAYVAVWRGWTVWLRKN